MCDRSSFTTVGTELEGVQPELPVQWYLIHRPFVDTCSLGVSIMADQMLFVLS